MKPRHIDSLVRILDIGGMIRESDERLETVDQALVAAEAALAEWVEENLCEHNRCGPFVVRSP